MTSYDHEDGYLPPYASITIPLITRLLLAIAERCQVGETIRPGNRTIATWIDASSISQLPAALERLHADEWIRYDGRSITLLRDPRPWPGDPKLHPDEIPGYLLSLPRQK